MLSYLNILFESVSLVIGLKKKYPIFTLRLEVQGQGTGTGWVFSLRPPSQACRWPTFPLTALHTVIPLCVSVP